MSLLDENARSGLLWEQEQPIAVLQSDVLVDLIWAQRQQQPSETPVIPMVVDAEPDDGTPPRDAKPPTPKKAKKQRPATATGKTHRVLKSKSKAESLLRSDAYRRLMDEELTMRLRLRYEEEDLRGSLRRHRRDDREFWQLLERQRLRREQYYRTRPLIQLAQPLPFH